MAGSRRRHLAILLAVPLAIAAATGLAREPENPAAYAINAPLVEPIDAHSRPRAYAERPLASALEPTPSMMPPEYPLAATLRLAHRSNYGWGKMQSYDFIVVHTMEGYYYGAQSWFQNPAADVSAHFCMRSLDGEVTQMVSIHDKAWHVGLLNARAIGIEHEGFVDGPSWYSWATYTSSAKLARWLSDSLDIPRDRAHILGHAELPRQTHEDPGPSWDWDLYMALIEDVVPERQIEGWVVERGRGCSLTATRDTWVKTTLEPASELDDTQKCAIEAGGELGYVHASSELAGHLRLTDDPERGLCPGFVDLERSGYVVADHFSPRCDAAETGVAGVTVELDGGREIVTDARGYFSFIEVEPGAHTLDVHGGSDYADTVVPVDLDVFPGSRVIIELDALAELAPSSPDPLDATELDDDALFDELDAAGCEGGVAGLALPLFGLLGLRRRREHD